MGATMTPAGMLDAQAAAKYLDINYWHLAHLRASGKGPSYFKAGSFRTSRIFYAAKDLDAWRVSRWPLIRHEAAHG